MIFTYAECKEKYKTGYEIEKAVKTGQLKRVRRGIFSDEVYESDLEVISRAFPGAVFTMNSAFYYHGLTDTIPVAYHLMTDKDAAKIKDNKIVQYFDNNHSLELGLERMRWNAVDIRIFSRERMLIELIRNKNKLSFDYYKEIITAYRGLIQELDIQAVQEYALSLPKTRFVMNTLQLEVF